MPKLLINLRGTSGSGKTTVVKKFIERSGSENLRKDNKVVGIRFHPNHDTKLWTWPVFAVGKYDNACGGMDTVPTQADCATYVAQAYEHGHVICEGLLASGVGPKATLPAACIALGGANCWFLCLDTPLEVCLDRVRQRREARGKTEPLDPKNTAAKWKQTRDSFKALEDAGANVRWLPYETAYEKVLKMLERADAAG